MPFWFLQLSDFLEYSQSSVVITTILFWNTFINWKKESHTHYLITLPWPLENVNGLRRVLLWKSQFLDSLIRSLGPLRRRKGSGALKEEKRTNFFFFFKPRSDDCTTKQLILLKIMFSLKLCTQDCIRTMYPAWYIDTCLIHVQF